MSVYHYPHWPLADGVTPFLFQQPLRTFDFVQRDVVGFLPRRNQVFTAVIDIKPAWLGFGRLETFNRTRYLAAPWKDDDAPR